MQTLCKTTVGVARETTNGYATVYDPRVKRNVKSHRYVWEKANGPVPKGMVVMHKCDNRYCTLLEHLELGTQSKNLKDMYARGRQGNRNLPTKENHHNTTLTQNEVDEILATNYYRGMYSHFARKFKVTRQTISNIKRGKTWPAYKEPNLGDLV